MMVEKGRSVGTSELLMVGEGRQVGRPMRSLVMASMLAGVYGGMDFIPQSKPRVVRVLDTDSDDYYKERAEAKRARKLAKLQKGGTR